MSQRVRRSTTKAVNYSKEQEFSDDDIFEDGHEDDDNDVPRSATSSRRKQSRPRKSTTPYESSVGRESFSTDYGGVGAVTSSSGGNNGYDIPEKFRHFERGYDVSLGHIRERFDFMPELELDGTPKVELIVGRRLIADGDNENSDNDNNNDDDSNDDDSDEDMDDDDGTTPVRKRSTRKQQKSKQKQQRKNEDEPAKHHAEYEYLIKYKGKSYLHLEWKAATELESLNKSAKTLYRRFLKKIQLGTDEEIEDPDFDPAFIQPQRIVDEDEVEVHVELNDEELMEWERQRERENQDEESSDDDDGEEKKQDIKVDANEIGSNGGNVDDKEAASADASHDNEAPGRVCLLYVYCISFFPASYLTLVLLSHFSDASTEDDVEIGEPGTLSKVEIMRILNREGPYYPTVEGSNNPFRDGYITEPPKKPRASYLFFQGVYRSVFQKRMKGASVGEIMKELGDTWGAMTEEQQAPFVELAKEEATEYENQRMLLEKAQKPTELWQPMRRCLMVVERLSNDSFAEIFLEPVDIDDFPDYLEYVETPMDLGTVRTKINNKKYMGPEQFARDMRKVRLICHPFLSLPFLYR